MFCFNAFFIARSLGHLSFIRFYPFPILFFLLERKTFEKVELKYDLLLIGAYALISIISWYYFTFAIFITAIYFIFKLIPLSKISIDKIKTIILIYVPALFVVILVNYPMFEAFAFGSKYFRPYPFRMDNKELNLAIS